MIDELYLQALDKAYLELKTQLSNKNAFSNEFECFYAICTMLHWSLDCIERIWANDKQKYKEFRFANNQLKHNVNIVSLQRVGGGLAIPPQGIPFGVINADNNVTPMLCFPQMEYKWSDINDSVITDRFAKMQLPEYRTKLVEKSVVDTLTALYQDIKNQT